MLRCFGLSVKMLGSSPMQATHVLASASGLPARSPSALVLVQDVDGNQHVQVPWQVAAVLGTLLQHTPNSSKQPQHGWAGVAPIPVLQPALCFMQVVERLLLYCARPVCGQQRPGCGSRCAGDAQVPGHLLGAQRACSVVHVQCASWAGLGAAASLLVWTLFR